MKRIILTIIFFLNLVPYLHKGSLKFECPGKAFAQTENAGSEKTANPPVTRSEISDEKIAAYEKAYEGASKPSKRPGDWNFDPVYSCTRMVPVSINGKPGAVAVFKYNYTTEHWDLQSVDESGVDTSDTSIGATDFGSDGGGDNVNIGNMTDTGGDTSGDGSTGGFINPSSGSNNTLPKQTLPRDCNGDQGGNAYIASCGCIGGKTGKTDCPMVIDCHGDTNGTAYLDACGCVGGNTGIASCPPVDCNGDINGTAHLEACGCVGGKSPIPTCAKDCNGDANGTAYTAACGCIGGNTGITACADCHGDIGGTAYTAECGCIGGNTGIEACIPKPTDCHNVVGGSAYTSSCGCIGGDTGITHCPPDCNGDVDGIAYMSKCGCIGGKTGLTSCPPILIASLNREAALEAAAQQDNTLLIDTWDPYNSSKIPCDVLQKFKDLANFTPPQSVFDRFSALNLATDDPFRNQYYLQQIKYASGNAINFDRFEIKVSTLPLINGERDPHKMMEFLRKHINDLIDQSITTFGPYVLPSKNIDDTNLWNSNNPVNGMLHLHIPAPWYLGLGIATNDGSVVVDDDTNDHWTVSTIKSTLDGMHPVTGNRRWGYDTNTDGSYTFYVTGADRITNPFGQLAQTIFNAPFGGADDLWKSYQRNVASFVNHNSGVATTLPPKTFRPDYSAIKQYLDGTITLTQLKNKNGCQ